jgi:hypothetical protein
MPRRQVASGGSRMSEFLRCRRFGCERRLQAQKHDRASDGGVPVQQQRTHDRSIRQTGAATESIAADLARE